MLANSRSWSVTQWKVAVENTASRAPVPSRASGRRSRRSIWTKLTLPAAPARRDFACSIIGADASRATTWPWGSTLSSSSVTRPVPHPASRTVSSPVSSRRSSTALPQRAWGVDTLSYRAASHSMPSELRDGPWQGQRPGRTRRPTGHQAGRTSLGRMDLLRWEHRPALRRPVLMAAFEGWNDAGNAASEAVAFLSQRWGADHLRRL